MERIKALYVSKGKCLGIPCDPTTILPCLRGQKKMINVWLYTLILLLSHSCLRGPIMFLKE